MVVGSPRDEHSEEQQQQYSHTDIMFSERLSITTLAFSSSLLLCFVSVSLFQLPSLIT